MAKFIVPLFITRQSKIIGPFTFGQFVLVAIAGGICFLLFLLFGGKNLIAIILASILIIGVSLVLAFVKVGGHTISMTFKNFFNYTLMPKIFTWQRKLIPPKISKVQKFEKTEVKETSLKIIKESNLHKLLTQVETKKLK
jgi:hypothetical protein